MNPMNRRRSDEEDFSVGWRGPGAVSWVWGDGRVWVAEVRDRNILPGVFQLSALRGLGTGMISRPCAQIHLDPP